MTERSFEDLSPAEWHMAFETVFADGTDYRLPAGTILTAHRTEMPEEASPTPAINWDFIDHAGTVIFRMIRGDVEPLILRVRPNGDVYSDLSVEDFTQVA